MSKRLLKFESFKEDAWFSRVFKKLTNEQVTFVREFITDNDALSKGEFEAKVNRMFLDNPNKPKNFAVIMELLTCANSSLRQ